MPEFPEQNIKVTFGVIKYFAPSSYENNFVTHTKMGKYVSLNNMHEMRETI